MESSTTAKQSVPPQALIGQMVTGAWVTKVMADVTRLGVPDVLKKHGPTCAVELTAKYGIKAMPDALERALRACASLGLFTEDADGKFGPTQLSDVLTADSPASVKHLVQLMGGLLWRVWTGLPEALRTGEPQAHNQVGMDFFEYLGSHPSEMNEFGEAMKGTSAFSMNGVLDKCDFTGVKKVVDVGGGFGHLVVALLEKYPSLRGVLLDRPELIPVAKERFPVNDPTVASRLEYVGGDMFESVPPADAYVLKLIIHDWSDTQCVRILKNCRESMEGNGRVICVDAVVPPMGVTTDSQTKLLDLNMLLVLPGKERTRANWEELYHAAGLEISSVTPIQDYFSTSVVEGARQCRSPKL
jgi:hypothetical protein